MIGILRQNADNQTSVKPDRPLNERVTRSLVFGLKQMFTDWKWDIAGLWADPDDGTFSIGKKIVVTVTIQNKQLKLEYGDEWESYLNDKSWPQWNKLVTDMVTKLTASHASNTATKGVGKTNK